MSRPIKDFMTANPITIAEHQPLTTAHRLMRDHGVRHLPVLSGGKLVGLVSMRDLYFLETLPDVVPDEILVSEAMSADVFTASPDTPLEEVVEEMADNKYGSVVIVDHGRVCGVFTTIDALRALARRTRAAAKRATLPASR